MKEVYTPNDRSEQDHIAYRRMWYITIGIFAGLLLTLGVVSYLYDRQEERHRVEVEQHYRDSVSHTWLTGGEIPTWDTFSLSLRRLKTVFNGNDTYQSFLEYKALYYQTHNDKYRLLGNKKGKEMDYWYKLEKEQRDSLDLMGIK